jgi:hypothetical protein
MEEVECAFHVMLEISRKTHDAGCARRKFFVYCRIVDELVYLCYSKHKKASTLVSQMLSFPLKKELTLKFAMGIPHSS